MVEKKRLIRMWFTAALGGLVLVSEARADDEARELVRRVVEASAAKTTSARMTLTSGSELREIEVLRLRSGGFDRVQIKVTSPFTYKGIRYVFQQEPNGKHDHFSYLPALKRTTRIADDGLSQPFLATSFYVTDMIPPDLEAWTYRFTGEDTVSGRKCRLVEAVPRDSSDALYGRTVAAIDPVDLVMVRTEFFDPDGKPFKVWSIDRLERIDGMWTPLEQTMKLADDGTEWHLKIEEIRYGMALAESDFAPVGLDR